MLPGLTIRVTHSELKSLCFILQMRQLEWEDALEGYAFADVRSDLLMRLGKRSMTPKPRFTLNLRPVEVWFFKLLFENTGFHIGSFELLLADRIRTEIDMFEGNLGVFKSNLLNG